MKGQISVEHLVLLGVVMAILIPGMIAIFDSATKQELEYEESMIQNIGSRLVETIDSLQLLGGNSKKTLKVSFPQSFRNMTIDGNNTIVITYANGQDIQQAIFVTKANINGAQYGDLLNDLYPGLVEFSLQEFDGYICVSHGSGYCAAVCGNNIIDPGELCDGSNIGNIGCSEFGMGSGDLLCNSQCNDYIINFCNGCISKEYCLDDSLQGLLNPPEVVEILAPVGIPQPVFHTSIPGGNPGLCGPDNKLYLMNGGGGLRLSLNALVRTGDYKFSGQVNYYPGNAPSDFAIQCDGYITTVKRSGPVKSQLFEVDCPIYNTNPDIRFIGNSFGPAGIDKIIVNYQCDAMLNCEDRFDSGFHCISQNHAISSLYGPSYYQSDYVIAFRDGFNAGFESWNNLELAEALEDVCDYTYYIDPANEHGCISNIPIQNLPLDPNQPAGDYDLLLNIIAGRADKTKESFKVQCGSIATTIGDIFQNNGIPNSTVYSTNFPGPTMTTVTVPCRFAGTSADTITISMTDCAGDRIDIERFRLRKKC